MSDKLDIRSVEELIRRQVLLLQKNGMVPKNIDVEEVVNKVAEGIDKAGGISATEKDSKAFQKILGRAIVHTAALMANPSLAATLGPFDLREFFELALKNLRPESKLDMSGNELKKLQDFNDMINAALNIQAENEETNELEQSVEAKRQLIAEFKIKAVVDRDGSF